MEDFLERDGDTFVKIRKSGQLGWEQSVKNNDGLSSFIIKNSSKEEAIRRAYSFAGSMLLAMNLKQRVSIKLTADKSATNSQTVWVATKMFDDDELTLGQALDIFTGLTVHEGCHLKYTDFTPRKKDRIEAWLANLLEDERIEMLCSEDTPGLANFLACSKYYYFGKTQKIIEENQEPITRILNAILGMVRYPRCLKQEDLEEYCDILLQVREIICPFPATQNEVDEAARKIYELLKELIKQESQDSDSGESDEKNDNSEKEADSQNNNSDEQTENDEQSENKSGNSTGEGKQSMSDSEATQKLEEILNEIIRQEENNDSQKTKDEKNISSEVKKNDSRLGKLLQGDMEEGVSSDILIHYPEENKMNYQKSLERVSRYIPAIRKALQYRGGERKIVNKGLRSGVLDTSKIAEAYQGVETVYMRNSTQKATDLAVCVLIDQSGSMYGPNIEAATDTAILLTEALSSIKNLKLFIYGHDADSKVNIYSYVEDRKGSRYSLGSTASYYSNLDSKAILEVAGRVRKQFSGEVLFFVISDGSPCEDPQNVKKAVKDLKKKGFNIMSIGIEDDYEAKDMYENHVLLTDMSRLAIDLGKMIRKMILSK